MKKHALTVISLFLFFVLGSARRVAADEVTKWNETAGKVAFESGLSNTNGVLESRVYAMTFAAIHDALNAIARHSEPYALDLPVTRGASREAAVATAAHDVLVDQFNRLVAYGFPSQQAALDAAYDDSLKLIPEGAAKAGGIIIGRVAAAVILAIRVADGWDSQPVPDFNYPQGTAPGEYRFTPPSTSLV